ncbi:MAG: ABC transporter substrate-binding protein [Bifidobacteriaceae bacterium]|jgi:peptide/nickel transport system substrate-binding protein|nr:ABC transporter substrate-binding protein [Bifidobacteriaceae bacterium]
MSQSVPQTRRGGRVALALATVAALALTAACSSDKASDDKTSEATGAETTQAVDDGATQATDTATEDTDTGSTGDEGAATAGSDVLHIGFLSAPSVPDPDRFYGANGLMITLNAYEGLVKYEQGNHDNPPIVASLATDWTVTDNTVYEFTLRDGVQFADGTPVTSAVVKSSIERRIDIESGLSWLAGDIKQIDTPDDQHITITLNAPNSAYLDYLASPYGLKITNPALVTDNPDDLGQAVVAEASFGTGPYQLTSMVTDTSYTLTYNPNYWGGKDPVFKTVEITVYQDASAYELALEAGDEDLIIGSVASASQGKYIDSYTISAYSLPTFQMGIVYMNPNHDFFATAEARQAFYQYINWEEMVEQVIPYKGTLATGRYSRGAVPGDSIDIVYDEQPFIDYVATLPEGTEVEMGYYEMSMDDKTIAEIVAAKLQGLGLNATATARSESEIYGSWFEDHANAPDLFIQSNTWPDSNNGYLYGSVFWKESGGLNYVGCFSPEAEENLDKALETGDNSYYLAAADAQWEVMCNPTWDYGSDFVAAQPWLGNVEAAHTIAAPYTLAIYDLTRQ